MNKMTKEEKIELLLTTIVCLIPVIAGILLYPSLPEQIATHWDSQGNVNGMESKLTGAIIYPGILVLVNLIFPILLRTDPKYENMDRKLKTLTHWIIPVIAMFCSSTTLAAALGREVHIETLAPMVLGVLFVLIGNYLPKTKQSYTMGIKLPWTLNSEENWNHTHRMAGFIWVVGGLLMIACSFFPWRGKAFGLIAMVMVLAPCIYSFLYYRKENSTSS